MDPCSSRTVTGSFRHNVPRSASSGAAVPSPAACFAQKADHLRHVAPVARVASHPFPKVAVIIVNWNSETLLGKCLSALRLQTLSPDKMIVVDNGSAIKKLEKLEAGYPEVQFIRLMKNVGFAAANNIGVKAAEGCSWVALLNPDAFPEPPWLENLLRSALRYPEHSFFGSRLLCACDCDRLDGSGDVYHTSGMMWRRNHRRPAVKSDLDACEIFSACAAAALYRREAFLAVGGFDEDYFCYCEDVDLGFRLRLAGHRGMYIPDAVACHIGSATTGRRSDFAVYHGHRNLVWTFVKNMPEPLFWWYLPLHVGLNLFSLLWFSLQGQGGPIFRAKLDAVRGLKKVWRQRRLIQRDNKVSCSDLRRVMTRGLKAALTRQC
jgi:GT2 family glycosyltransferase